MDSGSNKLYSNRAMRKKAWEWLKAGLSLREVRESLIGLGHKYALSTIAAFKDIMMQETGEEIYEDSGDDFVIDTKRELEKVGTAVSADKKKFGKYADNKKKIADAFDLEDLVSNDAQVIDVLISKGFQSMLSGDFQVTPQTVMKALELKKAMLGKDYAGQTAWNVQELQSKLSLLLSVVNKHSDSATWERIMRDLEEAGWDNEMVAGV